MPEWVILQQNDHGILRYKIARPEPSFRDSEPLVFVDYVCFDPMGRTTLPFAVSTLIALLAAAKPDALASPPDPTKRRIVMDAPAPDAYRDVGLDQPALAPAPDTEPQTLTDQDCLNLLRCLMAAHRFVHESSHFNPDNTYQRQLKLAVDACMASIQPPPPLARVATDFDLTQSQIEDRVRDELRRVDRALAEDCTCACSRCIAARHAIGRTVSGRPLDHCYRETFGCAIVPL